MISSSAVYYTNASEKKSEEIQSLDLDINTQLGSLYDSIGDSLLMDSKFVSIIHMLAGSNIQYADMFPNIFKDQLAVEFDFQGVDTEWRMMPGLETDASVERACSTYLPDALYSISYDVALNLGQRYLMDRGGMQIYFNALQEEVKQELAFSEAVLLYMGTPEDTVNNLYRAYEKILYDKQEKENVIEITAEGLKFKGEFNQILIDNGFIRSKDRDALAIIFSFDKNLAANASIDTVSDEYVTPYIKNYTSRENMMVAAISLVGKVRYVWGGGHSGASYIDGINPMWSVWNDKYPKTEYGITSDGKMIALPGYDTCIKPSGSWCPTHGYSTGVCGYDTPVYSTEDYINKRKEYLPDIDSDKFRELLKDVNYSHGIMLHTLEGLDCSGFASWLYNQITDKYTTNSTAMNFVKQRSIQEVPFGEQLLPGDIFSWTSHIVVIVGPAREDSKAYVTVEQTRNVLKFGVVYYSGASSSDIALAKQIATEGNELIGGLYNREEPHCYCMNSVGRYTEVVPAGEVIEDIITGTTAVDQVEMTDELNEAIVDTANSLTNGEADSIESAVDNVMNNNSTENGDESSDNDEELVNLPDEVMESDTEGNPEESAKLTEDSVVSVSKQYYAIGRFVDEFIDEETQLTGYNKPIKDLTAAEIIQHTIEKLPISYITGYNEYSGDIFDKKMAASDLGYTYEEG